MVENVPIQIKWAQYYIMIGNCTFKYSKHKNSILKDIFLSSLSSLKNGFVLRTNIWISIYKRIRNEYSRFHIR